MKLNLIWITAFLFACAPHGTPSSVLNTAIVNGTNVSKKEDLARSVVALIAEIEGGQSLCTGTLLSDQVVLTAAHCVDHTSQMAVVFNTRVDLAKPENIRSVDGYIQNPRWHFGEETGDLALVHFTGGLPQGYRPVKLVGADVKGSVGMATLFAGFGVTDGLNHKGSGILRQTESKILGFTANAEVISDGRDSSVCFGDSGGPMFIETNGEWLQFGVAHSVTDRSCTQASVHTLVANYLTWIDSARKNLE